MNFYFKYKYDEGTSYIRRNSETFRVDKKAQKDRLVGFAQTDTRHERRAKSASTSRSTKKGRQSKKERPRPEIKQSEDGKKRTFRV